MTAPDAVPARSPLRLSGRQHALHEALATRSPALATIYLGALTVLADEDNPDRKALCAHGMRELLEKLPLFLGLPVPVPAQPLNSRVKNLRTSWDRARTAAKCTKPGEWDGDIDPKLRKVLGKVQRFFEEAAEVAPKRAKQVASLIEQLDQAKRPLPDPVKNLRVNEWTLYHDHFQGVAHHNAGADVASFDAMMSSAEGFLIDQLHPRTFEDHREIEARIAAAEGSQ